MRLKVNISNLISILKIYSQLLHDICACSTISIELIVVDSCLGLILWSNGKARCFRRSDGDIKLKNILAQETFT